MVRVTEYRITMPISVDEYHVSQSYIRSKMAKDATTGPEGVEVRECRPFSDPAMGSGQFYHNIYYLESKVPRWVRALVPKGALIVEEKNWNAHPQQKLVITCPYFKEMRVTVETINLPDRGETENAFNLPPDRLAARKVEVVDIGSQEKDLWSRVIQKKANDPSKIRSEKLNRGPLLPGWQSTCSPVMTTYKLVTLEVRMFGLSTRLEALGLSAGRALMREAHRNNFAAMDEWCELTIDDIRRIEQADIADMKKKLKVQAAGVAVLESGDASDGSDEFQDVPDEMEGSDEGEGEEDLVTAVDPMVVC